MKTQTNFKSCLTRLRGLMLNLGYHSVVTLPSRCRLHRTLTIILLLLCIGVGNVWGAAATLPVNYSFTGGKSSLPTGVTQSGLGSDYAAGNSPYLLKFDGNGDYIQIQVDAAAETITIGVKEFGTSGASIQIQGSADGSSFTTIQTLSFSQGQNKTSSQSTSNSISSSYRYFRVKRNSGSNFGLGTLAITKAAASCIKIDAPTVTATPGNGRIDLSWSNQTGASSYTVTKTPSGGSVGTPSKSGSTWSCAITGLTNGTTYTWSVEAVGSGDYCASGNTAASASATPNVSRTITYYDKDGQHTTSLTDGTNIADALNALYGVGGPTSCDATNYEYFVGWKDGSISGTASSVTLLDDEVVNSTNAAKTFYAVWSDTDPSAGGSELFSWEGSSDNGSTSLTNMSGVTANGLGSDYAASNAPYRVKLDDTGDYIIITVTSPPTSVALNIKMLGGENTSSITVQESTAANGTFTDVETLSIEGNQNDVLELETSNSFAATTRAIKLYFTKGSNVGLGGITVNGSSGTANYITTCCTSLGQINGPISLTQSDTPTPTSLKASWSMSANTGIASYTIKVYDSSDNLVKTIESISNSATTQNITGLSPCTTYYAELYTVSSGSPYCEGGLISTSSKTPAAGNTTTGYTITYTKSNVSVSSGTEVANQCAASDVGVTYSANSGFSLPSTISVTNAGDEDDNWMWDSSTGELIILDLSAITGNVTVTITGVANACTDFSFHTGTGTDDAVKTTNTTTCFTQVNSSTTWIIENYTIPSDTKFFVGHHGYFYTDNLGSANSRSAVKTWTQEMFFEYTKNYGDGNRPTVGQATGAKGTLSIWSDNNWNNCHVGFTPQGYVFKLGSTNLNMHSSATLDAVRYWETDIQTLTSSNISGNFQVNLYTGSAGGVACDNTQSKAMTTMGVKSNSGNNWRATSIAAADANTRGFFRIDVGDGGAKNWNAHWVPTHRIIFHSNYPGGGGPADTYSVDVSVEETNSSIALASAPTNPTGYTFDGWYTAADGGTKRTGNQTISAGAMADVELYAHWTANTINLTLDKNNNDASGSTNGSATVKYNGTALESGTTHATRSHYTLEGYYAEAGCTNKVLNADGTLVNYAGYVVDGKWVRNSATTLHAKWIINSYTVTWYVGESTSTKSNVTHGTTFSTLEASAPAHADNALAACGSTKFIGWVQSSGEYTEDGKTVDWYNTHKFSGSDEITANTDVYAMYAEASGGGNSSEELTASELTSNVSNSTSSYGTEHTYTDGEIVYLFSVNVDAAGRPWVQMKKEDATAYIGITAPGNISRVDLTITTATNESGGIADISKHTKLPAGTSLNLNTETTNGTSHRVAYATGDGSSTSMSIVVSSPANNTLYLQPTGGACRIWGMTVYYSSVTYSNYRTGCTVSCGAPSDLTYTGVGKTGATIGWTDGGNGTLSRYEYAVWVDGDEEPTSGFTDNGKNTSKTLTGLYSGTKYNWKVRKVCTGDDNSRWSYSSFTTTAATLTFSVPTGVAAVSSQASNDNLPEAGVPTSCGSCWVFAGWTASTTYSDADAPADLMPAGTKARVSGDKTLYAVYKNDRFMLIYETADLEAGKDYVVTYYDLDSSNEYALSNAVSSSYTTDAAPVDITSLTRETGEGYFIFNPTEAVIWSFSGTTSSGQLYNAAANNYVNLTGSGCVVSTTDNLTFSVNEDAEWTISSTKYLRYYSTTSFDAVSTESDNTLMYLYKRVETSYATDPACDAYTVTWMRDKVAISEFESQSVTQCEGITTLPGTQTKLTCSDVHVGWSASEIMPASDVRPADFFTRAEDAPEITGNTTFYAVFADQSVGAATATNTTYTFNSAAWGDETNSWSSTTAGNQLTANQGIQILGGASAVGVTKEEYSAVTKVIVTYCTNSSKGTGSIAVKVGDTSYGSNDVTKPASGGQTLKTFEYTHAATDGKVTITASAATNSIYIYSVQIFYTGSGTTYSNYRTSCCNNSNFTFGSIADPVTEYVIVREDLESASEAVEIDCNYESANTSGAITWYSTRRAALGFPATGAYTWTTPSSQPTGLNIDVANKKISATATGVWTITLSQVSANNYCPADAVVTVRVKTLDKFIDNVNGNFGGDAQVREDVGDGIVLPTEAEFSTNNGCADGKVRRLVGWIKASDLATYRTSGRINTIDDLKTADASNKVIAPGTRVSATGCTWYAVWGAEQ